MGGREEEWFLKKERLVMSRLWVSERRRQVRGLVDLGMEVDGFEVDIVYE